MSFAPQAATVPSLHKARLCEKPRATCTMMVLGDGPPDLRRRMEPTTSGRTTAAKCTSDRACTRACSTSSPCERLVMRMRATPWARMRMRCWKLTNSCGEVAVQTDAVIPLPKSLDVAALVAESGALLTRSTSASPALKL